MTNPFKNSWWLGTTLDTTPAYIKASSKLTWQQILEGETKGVDRQPVQLTFLVVWSPFSFGCFAWTIGLAGLTPEDLQGCWQSECGDPCIVWMCKLSRMVGIIRISQAPACYWDSKQCPCRFAWGLFMQIWVLHGPWARNAYCTLGSRLVLVAIWNTFETLSARSPKIAVAWTFTPRDNRHYQNAWPSQHE